MRACAMMIYSSYASKKRRKFSFSSPFREDTFFLVFAGTKKISLFSMHEKKVEKNNEKEQKTEQNENASLSPSHCISL